MKTGNNKMKTGNNKMKTELTLASKEHASNWQEVTLARIVRNKRTFVLLDLAGNVIAKSSELMSVTHEGKRYAQSIGFEFAYYA